MPAETTIVQFVCFTTPLPRERFALAWTPFASSFVALGLDRIVLAERIGPRGSLPSFDFISRNEWPAEAYARAVRAGRVGDGGGGPISAAQGGSFPAHDAALDQARPDRDKVMALVRPLNVDPTPLASAVAAEFGGTPELQISVFRRPAASTRQRFDLVVELYGAAGQGEPLAAQLERALAGAIDQPASALGIYREVLTLP